MEILSDKYKLGIIQNNSILDKFQTKKDILKFLIGLITLTEEDRLRAGIYIGNEGRNWIDSSALRIFPPSDLE